jgi:hypothetical protein
VFLEKIFTEFVMSKIAVLPIAFLCTGLSAATEINLSFRAAPSATGQSLDSSFGGAADRAGFWNILSSGSGSTQLRTLNGQLDPYFNWISGSAGNITSSSAETGGINLLITSNFIQNPSYSFTLTGLDNGDYSFYYYSFSRGDQPTGALLVNGVSGPQVFGRGETTLGPLTQGVDYGVVEVEVVDGTLNVSGALTTWGGLAGFQLAAVPEPSTYGLILGGLALGAAAWRRRRQN